MLGHANPAGGYSGDVVGERHFAYLSSHRGKADCPAQGVRVYDIANPRKPRRISTFGRITGTWTEKTIVRRVHTSEFDGVLAVTSVQACENGFGGFALYDVTRPAHPRVLALVPTEPRGSHEIWLATARGHAWVYTAEAAAEFSVEPNSFGFHIYDVSRPRAPVEVGGWSACKELHLCSPLSPPPGIDERILVHSVITNAAATRAYLSYWNLGTVILDISNPAKPRYLGRTAKGQGNAHSAWLMSGGKVLLETHETDPRPPGRLEHRRPGAPGEARDRAAAVQARPRRRLHRAPAGRQRPRPEGRGPLRLLRVRPGRRAVRPQEPGQAQVRDALPAGARGATGTGLLCPGRRLHGRLGRLRDAESRFVSDLNSGALGAQSSKVTTSRSARPSSNACPAR